MKILNIHGYNGSSLNCAYSSMKELGFEVISPIIDYDTLTPEQTLEMLNLLITEKGINLLVGTSLGGFYAAVLSAHKHLPVFLINPCLMPFVYLPRLGYQIDVKPFVKLFGELLKLDNNNTFTIIGEKDEIIDSHDFTKKLLGNENFRIIPDGKHSGATLPLKEYFTEMLQKI